MRRSLENIISCTLLAAAVVAPVGRAEAQPLLCSPEPAGSDPRPLWTELAPPAGSGYPDYIHVTNNLQLVNSIRLLASIASRAAESLQDLSSQVENLEADGRCACTVTDVYAPVKRRDCTATFCQNNGTPAGTGYPLWLPTDVFKNTANTVRFALELIGFLDKIKKILEDIQNNPSVSALAQALQQLGTALDNLQQLIHKYQDYVDLLTEGYHLGGYSTERPDLHLCVGYGGHGAFAQMLNLFGAVSIGSRYTSYNLSREHRAQFRSGGFGVTAFGHTLSLLPGIETNLQIDGFKLWDAARPFGIDLAQALGCLTAPACPAVCCHGCGWPSADVDRVDLFHLVSPAELVGFDSGSDGDGDGNPGDGCLQPGEFLIQDFYPAAYLSASDSTSYLWPRPAFNAFDWERQNTAVFGAGLNFDPKLKRIEKNIPPGGIVLFPGATLFPKLTLDAGAEWRYEVNDLRGRLQEAINRNLPAPLQLTANDFERLMHFLQAPDVSQDNTSSAYVRPRVAADLVLGIALAKYLTLGITATIGTSVRVEPQGHGGLHDLNVALTDTLLYSNPPPNLPCTPILETSQKERCSNELHLDGEGKPLSSGGYSCDTTQVVAYHCQPPEEELSCKPESAEEDCPETKQCVAEYGCAAHGYCTRVLDPGPDGEEGTADDVVDVEHDTTYAACIGEAVCDESAINAGSECDEDADCIAPPVCSSGPNAGAMCTTDADCERGKCERPSVPCVLISPAGYFTPYQCLISTQAEITGWQGPGCHPLTVGFASACGCQTDNDCAPGENCAGGTCESSGQPVTCDCDPGNPTCPAGRVCVDGGCLRACSSNAHCAADQVCNGSVCVNPYGIPFAEQIVWQVSHTQKPQHAVSTYALSDILTSAILDAGLWIGLDLKLFKKLYHFDLLRLTDAWVLTAFNKSWYQAGLEARYQNDCDPATGNTVTNWQPGAQRVRRYPVPLPGSPAYGNGGTQTDLLQWCSPELHNDVADPDAPGEDDLAGSLTDLVEFGEAVGANVWALGGLCVLHEAAGISISEPFTQWVGDLSSLSSALTCRYTFNNQTHFFPCNALRNQLLLIWGCLDVNANPWAGILASHFNGANHPLDIVTTFQNTPVLDLDAMLIDPTAELTLDNLKPQIRNYLFATGAIWYSAVTQCWEARFAQVQPGDIEFVSAQIGPCCGNGVLDRQGCSAGTGGTPCEQCDDGNSIGGDGCNALCQIEGRVRPPGCGDGTLQAGFGETCDDGNQDDGDGCDSNCTLTSCGNGIVSVGEQCDDGNLDPLDGCEGDCTLSTTGRPTPTPTRIVAPPTPTPTRIAGTHTPSVTPSRTRTPMVAGDCNQDNAVTIDELIRGVNIALGMLPVSACRAMDVDGDGRVTVNELVRAVAEALAATAERAA